VRALAWSIAVAVVGLAFIGLIGGDPRAAHELGQASAIDLAGLVLAVVVGVVAWGAGRRRSWWLLAPSVILAIVGGLCGWEAAAQFSLAPFSAAHLSSAPGRVALMLSLTAVGMATLPALLAAIAGIRRRDRG
jgi:hypothetical protein